MKTGLILGKFMPLHKGHMALIEFALKQCDELIVLVSASDDEPIPGEVRYKWLEQTFKDDSRVKPMLLMYDEAVLSEASDSGEGVSKLWANYLKEKLPPIDVLFASEAYGAYMGRFLNCETVIFDEPKKIVPISAVQLREDPTKYWDLLPDVVRDYYTQSK